MDMDKVTRVRGEIASGEYETPERIEATADLLLLVVAMMAALYMRRN